MALCNYEESVHWMRDQPELADEVKLSYLDEDNLAAAKRFSKSEEFEAVKQILKLDRSPKSLTILDLGCGNGIASYAFAALGHHVYAVDPDESNDVGLSAVRKLQQSNFEGCITATKSFAESLPFDSATFDIVYTRQAVHHFADLEQGLRECSRVLKAKGRFLATREHVISDEQQLETFLENHILHKLHGGENAYQLQRYLSALQQAGLTIKQNLAYFDSVINHYPDTNAVIEEQTFQALEKKFGKTVAAIGMKFPVVKMYRARLSKSCNFPGRLHSFLAVK